MKKSSNTIRVGIFRRGNVSAKLNKDHSSSSNVQEQTNHQPVQEQRNHQPVQEQLSTQGNHDVSTKHIFYDEQHISRLTSPNHVRVHDINETNTNKQQQQTNDLHSDLSNSSSHPEEQQEEQQKNDPHSDLSTSPVNSKQELLDDLNEVPIKTNWSTMKKVLVGLSIAAVCAIIIVATVLAVVLTTSTTPTTTPSSSSSSSSSTSTTTIAPTIISAYWSFDNILTDLYGVYNGAIINGATFSIAGSLTVPYVGYGQALQLNALLSQQFSVSIPVLNLNSTSFTIEAWIYSTTLIGDRGIFGQCQCSTCTNQCFFFICRNNRLYVGFTMNDLSGTTNMAINTWYHVAFVYNSQTQQQILYLNGVQDSINYNVTAYQGKNGSIQIGSTEVYSATNYFTGYIDNVLITTQAKSASQILSDASVVVYYSFDLPNSNIDNGPNHLNGTANNTVTTTGRVNQAMRFTGFQSNFQVYGLYQVPYGVVAGKSFSVSMWINPTSTASSTLVQTFAASLAAASCVNLLGIYSPAGVIGELYVLSSNGGVSFMTGPFVTQNTWSHVSLTYSPTDGYTLYYNGIYFGATGATGYITSATFAYLFIGYGTACASASLNAGYQGSIDELYVHSRELTQSDVTALANA